MPIIDGSKQAEDCNIVAPDISATRDEVINSIDNLQSSVDNCNTRECDDDADDSAKIDEILTRVNQILVGVVLILDRFHIPHDL